MNSPLMRQYFSNPSPLTCWKTHERVDGTTKGAKGSCQNKIASKRPK
jgi:hypothetical protein|tara:strand:+ start:71 stop:211 length:141 start_codon:yes stop_codon:yes gene_type:complete